MRQARQPLRSLATIVGDVDTIGSACMEAQRESVKHLQALYGAVAGLCLAIAVERLLQSPDFESTKVLLLLGFLSTIVPFYHGTLRHLDDAYVSGVNPAPRPTAVLIDFFVLFGEGCILLLMAASLNNVTRYAFAFCSLLIVDIVWALLFARMVADNGRSWAHLKWLRVNVLTLPFVGVIGVATLTFDLGRTLTSAVLALTCVIRTAWDYKGSWRFYVGADQ